MPGSCPSLIHTLGHSRTGDKPLLPSQGAFEPSEFQIYIRVPPSLGLSTSKGPSQPAGPGSVLALNCFPFPKFSTGMEKMLDTQRDQRHMVSLSTQGSVPIMLLIGAVEPGSPGHREPRRR